MKINKDGHVFTILFTLVATVVLVFPLTLAFVLTKPIADAYWMNQHYIKTLSALGLPVNPADTAATTAAYKQLKKYKITDAKTNPITVTEATEREIELDIHGATMGNMSTFLYVTEVNGEKRFAGDFYGPGLWGNVALAVGVNNDASKLTGLQVLYQVETPGLGGRIGETWFTGQFTGKTPEGGIVFNLSGENKANGVDAIAGATITSTAVKDIVNNLAVPTLKALIARLGGNP